MRTLLLAPAVILFVFVNAAWGQSTVSGPDVGTKAPALKVEVLAGEFGGQTIDYSAERKIGTTVVMFVSAPDFSRPTGRYIKTLDTELDKLANAEKDVRAIAVWLSDDVAAAKEYMPRLQQSINLSRTSLAVFDGAKQGPDGWNIDTAAFLTTVVLRDGKVVARFGYKSTNETDVPEVLKAAQEAK